MVERMTRLPDWEARLNAAIEASADRPFRWGEWDCALFAATIAAAITGVDKVKPFRAVRYSDERGAAKALRDLGKGTLLKTIDGFYARKDLPYAQRGDLVWHKGAVGICMGAFGLFLPPENGGFVQVPRASLEIAWEV